MMVLDFDQSQFTPPAPARARFCREIFRMKVRYQRDRRMVKESGVQR